MGSGPVQAVLYLLTHPIQVIQGHVLDPGGRAYLRVLLAPAAYLPLLSPLTLLMAVPTLGINLLSSDASMRTGIYQYNADIVPVLVLAAIESVALLAGGAGWLATHAGPTAQRSVSSSLAALGGWGARLRQVPVSRAVMLALTLVVLAFGLHEQETHGYTPLDPGFVWPQQTAHSRLAADLERLIPPGASVSAQSDLVPHISQRHFIYMYPYRAEQSDMVFLDVTGSFYPFARPPDYVDSVQALLNSHTFHIVAAQDGYLLLARGAGPIASTGDPYGLPASFYSFAQVRAGQLTPHPLEARFGASLVLAGYDISPSISPVSSTYVTITTYWHVTAPLTGSYAPQLVLVSPDGTRHAFNDFATQQWLPPDHWQPGDTMVLRTWPIFLRDVGTLRLGMQVYGPSTTGGVALLPVALVGPAGTSGTAPTLLGGDTLVIFADARVR
jgi:hypothetical protein